MAVQTMERCPHGQGEARHKCKDCQGYYCAGHSGAYIGGTYWATCCGNFDGHGAVSRTGVKRQCGEYCRCGEFVPAGQSCEGCPFE